MKDSLRNLFSLSRDQADNLEIRQRILEGASLSGSNIYILIFAILIASVGLNMNSTAVVIGAMLISPLMGVIISFAYALAGQDFVMAKKAVQKTLVQVSVSIVTSTVYFLISPMNTFSDELMARTLPTFWDVLIAFFGGFSAIIALTRKNPVSNVIPGAAIATALMPPLCTTGYCLAHLKWTYAAGSLYLFAINIIFICFSAVTGLYLMKVVDVRKLIRNRKARRILAVTVIAAILPSGILAWNMVKEENAEKNFRVYVYDEFRFDNTQIVKSSISHKDKTVDIFLMGDTIEKKELAKAEKNMAGYGLGDYTLNVVQASSEQGFAKEELEQILKEETADNPEPEENREAEIISRITAEKEKEKAAARELAVLYPEIEEAGLAVMTDSQGNAQNVLVLKVSEKLSRDDRISIYKWLDLKTDSKIKLLEVPAEKKEKRKAEN